MNAQRILTRGYQNFTDAIEGLSPQNWIDGFVTGTWTVRDVVGHLVTYEMLQIEALQKFLDPTINTPLLDQKAKGSFLEFNNVMWDQDKEMSWQEVLVRYTDSYAKLRDIVDGISPELMAKPNTTTWYGEPSCFDDVIALNFGHLKHHLAQIKLFRTVHRECEKEN